MARQRIDTFGPDGKLVSSEEVDHPDAPPSDADRIASLTDAVDTLILDSLRGA